MLTTDAEELVAALKVKGALCAAEPGTSLQRWGHLELLSSRLGLGEFDTLRFGGQGACPALGPSTGLRLRCKFLQRPCNWGLGSVICSEAPYCPVPISQSSKSCFLFAFVLFKDAECFIQGLHITFHQLFLFPQPSPATGACSEHLAA